MFSPVVLTAFFHKDKKLILKRVRALGIIMLITLTAMFPAFWLVPEQINRRFNRQEILITPSIDEIEDLKDEFLLEHPTFASMSYSQKAHEVKWFTLDRIEWKNDIAHYPMIAHVATPKQTILRGEDDCQGQAVVMISLMLNLGFDSEYVWVVETPFHWHLICRDPAEGALSDGWEKDVENLIETGELFTLNRLTTSSREKILMIFNQHEVLYPYSYFGGLATSLNSTKVYRREISEIYESSLAPLIYAGLIALSLVSLVYCNACSSNRPKTTIDKSLKNKIKMNLLKLIVFQVIFSILFTIWVQIFSIYPESTLIMLIAIVAVTLMIGSESKFWKLLRIEKEQRN